jgi:DNA-binding protein H-NS
MSRYDDLRAQLASLQNELEEARAVETREAIETCKTLISKFTLSPFDLGFVKTQLLPNSKKKQASSFPANGAKKTYPPKYRNPANGETWSGRGHAPAWIEGDRDAFLIREAVAA